MITKSSSENYVDKEEVFIIRYIEQCEIYVCISLKQVDIEQHLELSNQHQQGTGGQRSSK